MQLIDDKLSQRYSYWVNIMLVNWILELGVTTIQLKAVLGRFYFLERRILVDETTVYNLDFNNVWHNLHQAVREFHPSLADLSDNLKISQNIDIKSEKSIVPFCEDLGTDKTPRIEVNYSGTPLDALNLAHEYFHALHIMYCHSHGISRPIHPIIKEIFAFLGEMSLIAYGEKTDKDRLNYLPYWVHDNEVYSQYADELFKAFQNVEIAQYKYEYNYPVARWLAHTIWTSPNPSQLVERLLDGSNTANELVSELCDMAISRTNYLPHYKLSTLKPSALETYRSLGAMLMSDIEYTDGLCKRPIGDYFDRVVDNLKSNDVILSLNQDQQIAGYAVITKADEGSERSIIHQVSPFGEYNILHSVIRNKLAGYNGAIHAHHERSARGEQLAW